MKIEKNMLRLSQTLFNDSDFLRDSFYSPTRILSADFKKAKGFEKILVCFRGAFIMNYVF
jgi:hypothetical protein